MGRRKPQNDDAREGLRPLGFVIGCFNFKIIKGAERHHYSMFDFRCSMLDVHFLVVPNR